MKHLKKLIITMILFTLALMAGVSAHAMEVNNDEELVKALRDESVSTIKLNYSGAKIGEFVTVKRNLTIEGAGASLTAKNGTCITFESGTALTLKDVVLTGENDFAIKSYGSVKLEGIVEFASGYGLLLNNGSALDSSATLVARTDNKIAIAANTNGGEITLNNINITDNTTAGTLLYIYRGGGKLTFSGSSSFKSAYGKAVTAGTDSKSQQQITIASYASVNAEAENAREGESYGSAFNIRECALVLEKEAQITAKGSYGGIYCDSLRTEEGCTITSENKSVSYSGGAVTVYGKVAGAPIVSIGEKNKISLKGHNGFAVYGCENMNVGKETVIEAEIRSGDTISSYGGSVTFGNNVNLDSVSNGAAIRTKKNFTCGVDCDINISVLTSTADSGISSDGRITIGDYSVVKCKSTNKGISAGEAITFGEYATFDCEKVKTGIETMRGVQTGKGCMISIKDASIHGVYATGTLLADIVSFGQENTVNITSEGSALYSGEAVIFNKGCSANLSCGKKLPAIWVNTTTTTQGYLRITGSNVAVTSKLAADSGDAAVNIVGSVIVEDGGRLNVESNGAFAMLCRAGDLIVATESTVCAEGGCAVFVEDGNVRISQGGALCANGTLDSGVRVSNGMLRVGEDSTIITEGVRYGAEILISGGIWLENPKEFDFRSNSANAIYIADGVFSVANTKAISAWYKKEDKTNRETWWNTDVSSMKPWEVNSQISDENRGYADYTQYGVNGTSYFSYGTEITSEGFESNIDTFRASYATRISAFKTRPVSSSNYLFIPSGRSFSWKLEAESVEGTGEVFELIKAPDSGTASIDKNGLLAYTAPHSTRGEQSLTYVVTGLDGAQSLPVQVIVNVTRSKPPAAYNHTFNVLANGSLITNVSATDFDGSIASLTVTENPAHGTISLGSDGTLKYTPEGSYVGIDSIKYTALDNDSDESNEAVVTFLIGIRGETTAKNGTYIAAKNEETSGRFEVTTAKDEVFSHIDIVAEPKYGTLMVEGTDFVYTPPENFAGTETFTYTAVTENGLKSNEAVISIITVPSEKPKADALKIECASGKGYSGKLSAKDLDGKISTYMIESYPQHGTLDFDASNGKFTYTASSSYTGSDSFTFYVYDDEGLKSEMAAVTISVDTYLNILKASGELTKIIVIGAISLAVIITLIVIIVTGTIRKRKKQDLEYEQQYGNGPYDDYYGF